MLKSPDCAINTMISSRSTGNVLLICNTCRAPDDLPVPVKMLLASTIAGFISSVDITRNVLHAGTRDEISIDELRTKAGTKK